MIWEDLVEFHPKMMTSQTVDKKAQYWALKSLGFGSQTDLVFGLSSATS